MRVFLDFEASSLGRHSYPIEVAWLFEDGCGESHLIRPEPDWTDWALAAETIHGISRSTLESEGEPAAEVASRMVALLGGHDLLASAPSWDGKWLSVLLRGGGQPRHALRLRDSEAARAEAAVELLRPKLAPEALAPAVAEILAKVREELDRQPVAHRALADAEQERQAWLETCRLASALLGPG
jgi:hypothetical protein